MASSDTPENTASSNGPVLFAYDGCDLAKLAIEQAGHQLESGREALVVCVWQTNDVGFVAPDQRHLKADDAGEVRAAAEETAAHGASLAQAAGFRAESVAIAAAPTWKGIVEVAEQREASLIVLGAHRRSGLAGHLLGSVSAAVLAHAAPPVLIVHSQQQ
ncbi:MAG TPA: universal stress protein [Solirubrobacteraceae bacterium]|jgi:nucleotide-binding universal stress UspA family protein|nr:universal stress protein [Solirubrobacteraceae bacterium]